MEPQLRYARASDGVTIAYTDHGRGPALIWLPSVPFSNLVGYWRVPAFRNAFEALGSHLRLVIYDARGTGHSQRDVGDVGLEALLEDLDAVVRDARIGQFALFGAYHACLLALAYAARHPTQVSHLILFGGSSRGWDSMAPSETQALLTLIERDWDLFTDAAAHAWLGWSAGENGRLMAENFRTAVTPAMARTMLTTFRDLDVSSEVPRITAPALVLHRQGQRQIPEEISAQLAAALPNGSLRHLSGESPSLFVTDPEGDLRLFVDFLTDGAASAEVAPARAGAPHIPTLTPREIDVLRLVAGGETNSVVAQRLGISVHTVERHLANLYPKIGARGRTDAVAYALRRGIA